MGLQGLHHVSLHVPDMAVAERFYTDTLGFSVIGRAASPSDTLFVFVKLGTLVIELTQPSDPSELMTQTGVWQHVAITVEGLEDVVAALKSKGVVFKTKDIQRNGFLRANLIFFNGPAGEMIELFEQDQ